MHAERAAGGLPGGPLALCGDGGRRHTGPEILGPGGAPEDPQRWPHGAVRTLTPR